jgi:hypothetical protein
MATYRFWCKKNQDYLVHKMDWFIHKGDAIQEDKPQPIAFKGLFLADQGRPKKMVLTIWADSDSPTAPVHRHSGMKRLVLLKADFGLLSQKDLDQTIRTFLDKQNYYSIPGIIEATFLSASTKYVLSCQGKKYDTVIAEYA